MSLGKKIIRDFFPSSDTLSFLITCGRGLVLNLNPEDSFRISFIYFNLKNGNWFVEDVLQNRFKEMMKISRKWKQANGLKYDDKA